MIIENPNWQKLSLINENLLKSTEHPLMKRDHVKLLSDDIKTILDKQLEDKEAVKVEKGDDGSYAIVYPKMKIQYLDKQTLQKLVGLPNFKGLRTNSIEFKNDYDLKKD